VQQSCGQSVSLLDAAGKLAHRRSELVFPFLTNKTNQTNTTNQLIAICHLAFELNLAFGF
jgi:hypothetical protein